MTEDHVEDYGLGSLHSPPDDRDWTIDQLYALAGLDAAAPLPAAFTIPAPLPEVLNQHATGRCVAFSTSAIKQYEDLKDQGRFDFDEATFFFSIGGTDATGAVPRVALQKILTDGYPALSPASPAAAHKIAAYYAVPVNVDAIKQAIHAFGAVLLSTRWQHSWFHPGPGGVLPAPDYEVGGHAIVAIGWDDRYGLLLQNSWGLLYGVTGRVWLPYAYVDRIKEAWKTVDQILPPKPLTYTLHIAPGATVMVATLAGDCISGWTSRKWGATGSSAPCNAPRIKKGCARGQATVALVTRGAFTGKWVRIGTGVTVTGA
jgi:hypothetical protein